MSVQCQKQYFNVDEDHRMAEVGLLSASDRVELAVLYRIRQLPENASLRGCCPSVVVNSSKWFSPRDFRLT